MKIIEEPTKFIVERTSGDENETYPHHIWRDPERSEIVVKYVDVLGTPSMRYTREGKIPTIEHFVDPITFAYKMRPGYVWKIWIDKADTGDTITVPLYADPSMLDMMQ